MLLWLACFTLIHIAVSQVVPYIVFTTRNGIHRVQINDSTSVEDLVVGGHGYAAVDYHYERDLLFWINDVTHTIHRARLSDGSSRTVLSRGENPVDLTVDWINDKLYWVDAAECDVREFDLETNHTRSILSTGTQETSFPRGIVIYPYKDNGWLYWTDQTSGSLEMGSINGGERQSLITDRPCLQALTIDYPTHTVYWADICLHEFQSLSLNGDRETVTYPFSQIVFFVSSMEKFASDLYWVEPSGIYVVERSGEGYRAVMSSSSSQRPISMQVVHPSQQPPDEEFREILNTGNTEFVCDPPCVEELGTCIPPGLCACQKGWTGPACNDDMDECTADVDGCDHICTNYAGGYNCSCRSGFSLANNSRSCSDIDECVMGTDGCEHVCLNLDGSYECSCRSGYSLNSDLHSCDDVDECASHSDKCQQICINNQGGYNCSCYSGYSLDNNLLTCSDVDECAVSSDDCQQVCTNNDGGYSCSCRSGYNLTEDMKTCYSDEVDFTTLVLISSTVPSRTVTASTFTYSMFSDTITRSIPTPTASTFTSTPSMEVPTTSLSTMGLLPSTIPTSVAVTSFEYATSSPSIRTTFRPESSIHPTPLPSSLQSTLAFSASILASQPITSTLTSLHITPSSPGVATTPSTSVGETASFSATTEPYTTSMYSPLISSTNAPLTTISRVSTTTPLVYPSPSSKSLTNSPARTPVLESSRIESSAQSTTPSITPAYSTQLLTSSRGEITVESIPHSTIKQSETHTYTSMGSQTPTLSSHIAEYSTQGVGEPSSVKSGLQLSPTVALLQAENNLEGHKFALIVVVIGVLPALIAAVLLLVVLWRHYCHDRGSWSPKHDITTDVAVEQPVPHVDTVEGGLVSMSSFRSLHEEKKRNSRIAE